MSNIPQGDIEIVYPSCPPPLLHQRKHRKAESTVKEEPPTPNMRIRFCRQRKTIEITRFVYAPEGGEWTKRVLSTVDGRTNIRDAEWHSIQDIEKAGIYDLREFVRICEAVEKLEEGNTSSEQTMRRATVTPDPDKGNRFISGSRSTSPLQTCDTNQDWEAQSRPDNVRGASWKASSAATDGQSTLYVVPRPTKLSALSKTTAVSGIGGNALGQALSADFDIKPRQHVSQTAGISSRQRWSRDEYSDHTWTARVQTRFIPSVGWCIRHGSRVSNGGRYQIMFLDGIALDVDVDEGYVEFISQSGDVAR
jgi:polo-like kinase 4